MNRKISSVILLIHFVLFLKIFFVAFDIFILLYSFITHLKLKTASLVTVSPSFVHLMRRNRLSLTATRSVARSDVSISLSRTSNADIGGKSVGGGVGDGGASMCRCNRENFVSTVLVAFFVIKFVAT